jgi:hypothetical protein
MNTIKWTFCASIVIFALLLSACSSTPSVNVEALDQAHRFIKAIENNDAGAAFMLLTKEAQSKIDYKQFSSSQGDFEAVVEAFKKASISTRNKPSKDEPSIFVSKLRGREGILRFIMVRQEDQWKIANILEQPPDSAGKQ